MAISLIREVALAACLTSCLCLGCIAAPIADTPFIQETVTQYSVPRTSPESELSSIAIDSLGSTWIAGSDGLHWRSDRDPAWHLAPLPGGSGPVFQVVASDRGFVWAAAWNGLFLCTTGSVRQVLTDQGPISRVALLRPAEAWAAGPRGVWKIENEIPTPFPLRAPSTIRALACPVSGELLLGSPTGLWIQPRSPPQADHPTSRLSTDDIRASTVSSRGELWTGGLGHLTVYSGHRRLRTIDTTANFPDAQVQAIALDRNDTPWVGTASGLVRWNDRSPSLFHSRRWLPDDDVRGIAFDRSGDAWVATRTGVSQIHFKPLTLAEKAASFEVICEARHVRPPGLVEKCRLRTPGDLTTWEPQDDDNDGGYTAVYLAMQSFRFAATQSEEARSKAARAFGALHFLREVTGHPGFLARTVIPSGWTQMMDPNQILAPAALAARQVEDGRFKYAPQRWRPSRDGAWLWKGDTSSDEICAHMFGYYFYYELAATTAEKDRVREQVRGVMDHILEHGFALHDLDGQPTRWGVWSPERLLNDPSWANEAGINAVELISFLKVAHHITGLKLYESHYEQLLGNPRWRTLVAEAKNLAPNTRTHIDDELLAFVYAPLLLLEHSPAHRSLMMSSLKRWHDAVAPDQTPFFEVLFAALTGRLKNLPEVVTLLRATPMDLIRWEIDNSRRPDVKLVRAPELEHWQTERLLPVRERGVPRTDDNPRLAKQGDGGRTESDGVFWQLPYWMARYYRFIDDGNANRSR